MARIAPLCRPTAVALLLAAATICSAQTQPAPAPPAAPAASQPASAPAGRTAIMARVLEVRGDVKHAPLDSDDWQPCKVDEQYPEQTLILTGLRSSLKLQVGADDTYTAVIVEPVTRMLISELYATSDTKRVNIGVGYGQIRAGVAEGGLKSDFTVTSPVATLSKRGTWNFGLFYERATDRFEIFLLDYGLVDAFSRATGEQRRLLPGELVTQVMRRWADEASLRRNVAIQDMLGQGDMEIAFNRLQNDGLRVIDPEGGQVVILNLSSDASRQAFADLVRQRLPTLTTPAGAPARREAFFGTGRGEDLIPIIIDSQSSLADKGVARPGTYRFSRSALEGWLAQQGKR